MNLQRYLAGSLLTGAMAVCTGLHAQLAATGHCGAMPTAYTNGASNDTIFYYPQGTFGTLTATPESGSAPWNFIWQVFNPGTNTWNPLSVESGVNFSTITSLNNGGYRVSI